MRQEPIAVYTDGSASFKVKDGGWSFVVRKGDEQAELYGCNDATTVSEMELTALCNALLWLPLDTAPLRIFCDSTYIINCMGVYGEAWAEQGWHNEYGTRPKHWQLIKLMYERLIEQRAHRAVTIMWIAGHRKYPGNVRADYLAGWARRNKESNWIPVEDAA